MRRSSGTGGIPKPAGYQPPPFLGPSIGNGLAVDYMGPTFGKAPRIYNWGINLQREIKKFLVEVDYAGNRGHRLNSTIDLNQVNPSYLFLGSLLQQTDHVARRWSPRASRSPTRISRTTARWRNRCGRSRSS